MTRICLAEMLFKLMRAIYLFSDFTYHPTYISTEGVMFYLMNNLTFIHHSP